MHFTARLVAVWCVGGLAPLCAQTIQLPTQRIVGIGTTVSVPDRGSMYLGGIGQSQTGSDSRGVPLFGKVPLVDRLFRNRAIGSNTGSSGLAVNVMIHDMNEMDQALLAAAAEREGKSPQTLLIARRAQELGSTLTSEEKSSTRRSPGNATSIAAIRAEQQRDRAAADQEALDLLAQAREAVQDNKPGLAKIYLRMAAKRGSSDVAYEARQVFDEIQRAAAIKSASQRSSPPNGDAR